MDLQGVVRDLRRNALVAVAAFLLCLVVGVAGALLPAKKYQATSTMLAQPSPTPPAPEGAVAILQYRVPQLPTEATSAVTVQAARALVPKPYAAAAVKITSASDPGTAVITITATSGDPGVAAAFANAVAARVQALQPKGALYVLQVLSPAIRPGAPSNPSTPVLAAAVGFGLIVAVFAALGAASIRRRRSRVTEIKERIGASVLAEIPRLQPGAIRPSELFISGRQPVAMEAFQELRSNLLLSVPNGRPMALAVTSCVPAEGKTSVTANLAWALASNDRPVVALDCDLRHPNLHRMLGVPYGPGVSSRATSDALAHASHTTNANLQVVPAGIPDRHPSDVISSNLPLFLEELREQKRTAVIDCPPMIGAAETVLIAAMADVIIVVVDTRRFNLEQLQQCILRLQGASNAVVGVVLNRVRFGRKRRNEVYHYAAGSADTSALGPPPGPNRGSTAASPPPARPAAPAPTRRPAPRPAEAPRAAEAP